MKPDAAPTRTRLLIVGPTPPPYNGMTVFLDALLKSNLKSQFELSHIDTISHQGNPNMGRFNLPTLFLALANILRTFKTIVMSRPTLVYLPISPTILGLTRDSLFILESRILRRRIVIHLHGGRYIQTVYSRAPLPVRAIVRFACRGVDRAIVLQESFRDAFQGLVHSERLTVIPNGVEDVISEEVSAEKPQDAPMDAPKVVTYLSNLQESKGFLDLLEAARLIALDRTDVRFVIAGSWFAEPSRKETLALVKKQALESRVDFPGTVVGQEKADLLLSSDVFVFPSFYPYEGQPLVLLEAMAAGLPIVTTDHEALPEIVIDKHNGLVVPTRDPSSLAKAIVRLLDDVELRTRIGQTNRDEYLEKYTADRCMKRMGDLFEEVLAA